MTRVCRYEVRHHQLERPAAQGWHSGAASDVQEGGDEPQVRAMCTAYHQHAIKPAPTGANVFAQGQAV